MNMLMYANFVLACIDLLLLPALLVHVCYGKNGRGGSLFHQYVLFASLLFLLTRAVACIPVDLLGILALSLKSRFYCLFYTVVALAFIVVFYLLKDSVSIKIEARGDGEERPAHISIARIAEFVFGSAVLALALVIFIACRYLAASLQVDIREILYTLAAPLTGAAIQETVLQGIPAAVLVVIFVLLYVSIGKRVFLSRKPGGWIVTADIGKRHYQFGITEHFSRYMLLFSSVALLLSIVYADHSLQIRSYIESAKNPTTLYEDYYVDPASVEITGEGKNLIYIYLESMETAYASKAEGGRQRENNYIPGLTALANENLSFSNSEQLGGFRPIKGTTWTMGSLFATTSGIPFSFSIGGNHFYKFRNVAADVIALGDILAGKGYQNEFLCGSDASYAGRENYFLQHGGYKIFDLFTAREKGIIPDSYYVWWGYEDEILYSIAKDELLRLAREDTPFNLTMLTADTHFEDGYICDLCRQDYDSVAENVISCADRQLMEFIEWCREQEFYKDTVIVISGDHPRMDKDLVKGIDYADRTVYNCFLNCGLEARTADREFTAMDMFPTVLSAMGFQIEGERLGLGVNLFSNEQTLCERMGFDVLDTEIGKYSAFYCEHFE